MNRVTCSTKVTETREFKPSFKPNHTRLSLHVTFKILNACPTRLSDLTTTKHVPLGCWNPID
jgi:hypothetical protein